MKPASMTTGVFGGSFDPIHTGHTSLASHIVETGLCDRVLLMVSPLNPLKTDRPPVGFDDRMAMARLATEGLRGVEASAFEAGLPLPSFTYRTLESLSAQYPDVRFRLIIGADNWIAFPRWRNHTELTERFSPIIYPRPGVEIDPAMLPANVDYLADAPRNDISSTELRSLLGDPEAVRPQLIDPRVWDYARARGLYSGGLPNGR